MNSWLFRSLVALYPKAWRERYSKEVGDLSAELLEAGETTRLHLVLELARSVLAERVRSLHRGRSMVVLSGSAALVVVVVATFLATNDFGLGEAASPRMMLAGWVPVAYRDAQVSVPPLFETVTSQPGGGSEILDSDSPIFFTSGSVCVGPPGSVGTDVCLLPLRQVPSPYASEKPVILNGVPGYFGPSGDYYVPSLGVEVMARGPLARRVVDTLTRSRLPTAGCMNANPQGVLYQPRSGALAISLEGTTHALSRVTAVVACSAGAVGQS
jgi:hypothetical protein